MLTSRFLDSFRISSGDLPRSPVAFERHKNWFPLGLKEFRKHLTIVDIESLLKPFSSLNTEAFSPLYSSTVDNSTRIVLAYILIVSLHLSYFCKIFPTTFVVSLYDIGETSDCSYPSMELMKFRL